jgi:hypothetical protein
VHARVVFVLFWERGVHVAPEVVEQVEGVPAIARCNETAKHHPPTSRRNSTLQNECGGASAG